MDLQHQRIVIVDDDSNFAALLRYELSMNGYLRVEYFQDPDTFLQTLADPPALVLLDYQFDDRTGLELMREIQTSHPDVHVMMLTAYGDVSNAVASLKEGAFDFIEKGQEAFPKILDSLARLQQLEFAIKGSRNSIKRGAFGLFGWMPFIGILGGSH